jgi:hypothetical protein
MEIMLFLGVNQITTRREGHSFQTWNPIDVFSPKRIIWSYQIDSAKSLDGSMFAYCFRLQWDTWTDNLQWQLNRSCLVNQLHCYSFWEQTETPVHHLPLPLSPSSHKHIIHPHTSTYNHTFTIYFHNHDKGKQKWFTRNYVLLTGRNRYVP